MNSLSAPMLDLALILLPVAACAADPVVANLSAAQRAGTELVDISYDATADSPAVFVALEISSDGGTTFSVPVATVSGAIGAGVAIGTGRSITWDAGTDWSEQSSSLMRFKVTAIDSPVGFALVPAGAFTMGNSLDGDIVDSPVRTVTLSAFYMGQNETTKAEWDAVKAWAVNHGYTDLAAGAGKAANHPVQTVSWWHAIEWCNARSEQEGLTPCYTVNGAVMKTGTTAPTVNWAATGYRLPTEAEWEKAARGGLSGKRFPWGDTIAHTQANYYSSAKFPYDISPTRNYHPSYGTEPPPYTAPVGSFAANGYGLHDMAGNVSEWCWDWYGTYAAGPQTDPRGAASGSDRVIRGGGASSFASYCRAALRNKDEPATAFIGFGFRAARTVVPSDSSIAVSANGVVETRAKVTLTTTAQHGTATGAGDYPPGSIATPTAAAAPGYVFTAWSGDASGTENPLSLLMDNPKSVTANFAPDPTDGDGDGLSTYLEVVIYGTNPALVDTDGDGLSDGLEVNLTHTNPTLVDSNGNGTNDGQEDSDGDGFGNLFEVDNGFNPGLASSTPELLVWIEIVPPASVQFRFNAAAGVSYRIEDTTDLNAWSTVEADLIGTGGVVTRSYSIESTPRRYYRARRN